jgi:hypothetical protein
VQTTIARSSRVARPADLSVQDSEGADMRGLFKVASGLVGGGVAIFGGVSAIGDETARDETGAIVESGGVGVFQLQVGDCVQLPDATEVQSVEGVPCDEPHDAQVFSEFDLAGTTYPVDIDTEAGDGCYERWQPTLGTVYEDDLERDITFFTPTPEGWLTGDRGVTCFVIPVDGLPVTGSVFAL